MERVVLLLQSVEQLLRRMPQTSGSQPQRSQLIVSSEKVGIALFKQFVEINEDEYRWWGGEERGVCV